MPYFVKSNVAIVIFFVDDKLPILKNQSSKYESLLPQQNYGNFPDVSRKYAFCSFHHLFLCLNFDPRQKWSANCEIDFAKSQNQAFSHTNPGADPHRSPVGHRSAVVHDKIADRKDL